MKIEDIKQLSDEELDFRIDVDVFGKKESELRSGWIKMDDFSTYPMQYCSDIKQAREAQAKAIESADMDYLQNLQLAIWGNIRNEIPTYRIVGMLQAAPRQISEAVYLTLGEKKHE